MIGTVLQIASFDFFESIRSRKALALLALYIAGSLAASGMFVRFVMAFESTAAEVLSVGQTETAGAMTEELMLSENMLRFFEELVGDKELARALVRIPPLALFYGWLAFTFMPLLVTLTSGDAAASETASGSVRFALFRVDRLTWATGKLLGQAALMGVGIAAGAIAAFAISTVLLTDSHRPQTVVWLMRFSGRAFFYGFAYLGMAVGASLYAKSVNGARAAALIGLFVLGVGGNLVQAGWTVERFPFLSQTLAIFFPQGHDLDLWRVTFTERLPGLVMLVALGGSYFGIGYFFFARRDP